MKTIFIRTALSSLVLFSLMCTGCDDDFYLNEKEFYSLRGQIATQNGANMVFANLRGQMLQINFDNSVSPPRIQNTNLGPFLRNNVPTLGILEGYPSFALSVDRVSQEIEAQFDNWLASELALYTGPHNAKVRLLRVDAMRVLFTDNPSFTFSENRIAFVAPMSISVDCRIKVDALDAFTNFFVGVNGTYDVSMTMNNFRARGEMYFVHDVAGSSVMQFRFVPTAGQVTVNDRGGSSTPQRVKDGIREVVGRSLSVPVEQSIRHRYDYFQLSNCRVRDEFRCVYRERPGGASPETHTVFRGSDNKLYAAFRRNKVWSNYSPVKAEYFVGRQRQALTFVSDPSVARSGGQTIELAAVSQGGGLWYSQFNNGWKNGRYVRPQGSRAQLQRHKYVGRPAVFAASPGGVEVVVSRVNGTLVHLRRSSDGNWSDPVVLQFPAGRTYRDPVIASSDQRLFVAAVGRDDRIYTMVFDLQTGLWSQSSNPQSSQAVKFVPAIAASGDRQIDMVYVGQSGQPYHRVFTLGVQNIRPNIGDSGVSYGPEREISGNVTATPSLVATGFRQLDLIARGTDNVLRYNHFSGPSSPRGNIFGVNIAAGWSGWGDLNRNFYGTQLLVVGATEDFAAVASGSGSIDVVARLRANTLARRFRLHHNGFNAASFGRQPWKTVHWRGFQKVADPPIEGRPAIADL